MGYISKRQWPVMAAGLFATLLAGCDNATPTSRVDVGHTHTSYLPFVGMSTRDGVSSVNSISVVNGSDPSKILSMDSLSGGGLQVFDHGHFHTGKYDFKSFKITEFHMTTLIYSYSDELRRLDLAETTEPKSVKVSKEGEASKICHETMVRGNDFVNQDNSRLVYRFEVGVIEDQKCVPGPGVWHLVRLGMSPDTPPGTPPTTISRVVDGVYSAQTAALDGWVVVDGGFLKRYDADFALAGHRALAGSSAVEVVDPLTVDVVARLPDGHTIIVRVDGRLLKYDLSTDQTVALFDALGGEIWDYTSDGESVFFFVFKDGAMELYRIPLVGVAPAVSLTREAAGDKMGLFVLTANHVAYVMGTSLYQAGLLHGYSGYQVKIVSKMDGTPPVLVLGPEGGRELTKLRGVGGKLYVFTDNLNVQLPDPAMRVINGDAPVPGGAILSGYRFAGETYDDEFFPGRNAWDIKSFILQNGRRFVAYDPLNAVEKFDIGLLVAGDSGIANFAWSRGHPYGLVTVSSGGLDLGRLYFYNAEKAGSLVSVGSQGVSVNHKPLAVRGKASQRP